MKRSDKAVKRYNPSLTEEAFKTLLDNITTLNLMELKMLHTYNSARLAQLELEEGISQLGLPVEMMQGGLDAIDKRVKGSYNATLESLAHPPKEGESLEEFAYRIGNVMGLPTDTIEHTIDVVENKVNEQKELKGDEDIDTFLKNVLN